MVYLYIEIYFFETYMYSFIYAESLKTRRPHHMTYVVKPYWLKNDQWKPEAAARPNAGALLVRIGFWGNILYSHNNSIGNYYKTPILNASGAAPVHMCVSLRFLVFCIEEPWW